MTKANLRPGLKHWIFDLDNTLYRGDASFFAQIDKKMTAFISRYLALHPTEARKLQKQYLAEYGTSLSGMMAVHDMDPADFLDYVHDIDLALLPQNPALNSLIAALPGQKYIFTNGSRGHAKNVAGHLGIWDVFDGVFGIEDTQYVPKPKRIAYEDFNAAFNVDPSRAIFFEDTVRNLEVPKAMGMQTVLVTSDADWSHEPAAHRPHSNLLGGEDVPNYVDVVTDDLASWLSGLAPTE